MRIGIPARGFFDWGGGLDFLHNITSCMLAAAQGTGDEFFLLVPSFDFEAYLNRVVSGLRRGRIGDLLRGSNELVAEAIARFSRDFPELQVCRVGHSPGALAAIVRTLRLDCLLPALSPIPGGVDVPWIGYMADFQHRYLAELFSPRTLRNREARFRNMIESARTIVVNSRAVAQDIRQFYPECQAAIVSLPFAPCARPEWFETVPAVPARYGVGSRYFIISNQFWVHKNHGCAFEAFARLDAPDVQLVCTGATEDHRRPRYFEELKQHIASLGIGQRVRILGHIPKRDQIELLKGATALVQPTRFEGDAGGNSTWEAIALGVPAIVSNIPVNRESTAGDVTLFDPDSPAELARCMERALAAAATGRRPEAKILLEQGLARRVACGRVLIDTAVQAREEYLRKAAKVVR